MKIIIIVWFSITCLFTLTKRVDAAGLCCQLSSGVQESLANVAAPGEEEFSVQVNYSLTKMNKFRENGVNRSLEEAQQYTKPDGSSYTSVPITMDMVKYTLTAGYGFSPTVKAFISVPLIRNTMDMASYQGPMMGWMDMTMAAVAGTGDATIMALYRLSVDRDIRPTSAVTIGIGLKTPTGSFMEKTQGNRLIHAHMQPGTGSWDPLFSIIYAKIIEQFQVQADATWQYTSQNRRGYEFGDSLAANLNSKYAVIRQFNITAGLTYLRLGRARDRNGDYYDPIANSSLIDDPANTGGQSMWFSPGIQIFPGKDIAIDAKVQLPVWERVNGIQLVSSYRVLAGVSYSF